MHIARNEKSIGIENEVMALAIGDREIPSQY